MLICKFVIRKLFKWSSRCRLFVTQMTASPRRIEYRDSRTIRVLRDSAASASRKLFYVTRTHGLEIGEPTRCERANAATRRWSRIWFRVIAALRKSDSVAIGFL